MPLPQRAFDDAANIIKIITAESRKVGDLAAAMYSDENEGALRDIVSQMFNSLRTIVKNNQSYSLRNLSWSG